MSGWTDDLSEEDHERWDAFVDHFRRDALEKIGGSAIFVSHPPDERRFQRAVRRRAGDGHHAREADHGREAARRRFLVYTDQSFSREGTGWSPPSILFDRRGRWQAGVWRNLPDKLAIAADRLAGVALECGNALELIPRYDQEDAVIYCDPPYAPSARLDPGKGYRHDADEDFWGDLLDVLRAVENAAVILSGYPCAETEDLDWRMIPLKHKRNVQTRSGSTLSDAPEAVWLNANVPDPLVLFGVGAS